MPMLLAGCIAGIREDRTVGAPRPAPDSSPHAAVERRAAPDGGFQCRRVVVGDSRIREVDVRRTVVNRAQEQNMAFTSLLAAGLGLVAYGQDQVQCPQQGGSCSTPTLAGWTLVALAAVPVAFLAYNATAARDERYFERLPAEATPVSDWGPCAD
jgi:hypothetical protein